MGRNSERGLELPANHAAASDKRACLVQVGNGPGVPAPPVDRALDGPEVDRWIVARRGPSAGRVPGRPSPQSVTERPAGSWRRWRRGQRLPRFDERTLLIQPPPAALDLVGVGALAETQLAPSRA